VSGLVGGAVGGLVVAVCLARLGKGRWESRLAMGGLVLATVGFAGLLTGAVYLTGGWQTVRQREANRTAAPATSRQAPPTDGGDSPP